MTREVSDFYPMSEGAQAAFDCLVSHVTADGLLQLFSKADEEIMKGRDGIRFDGEGDFPQYSAIITAIKFRYRGGEDKTTYTLPLLQAKLLARVAG